MTRKRVLFACTHNSARSQMAEAMVNAWGGEAWEARSAGTEVTEVRPQTITVMAELGIDLAGARSKSLDEFRGQAFDWFVTVCDDARESCPVLPGVPNVGHWNIDDPSQVTGTDEQRLEAFRTARAAVADRVHAFLEGGSA
ncbi:MAG TPA: arsenate reductase ArsC [Candidatus Limnocylindria bacterium]